MFFYWHCVCIVTLCFRFAFSVTLQVLYKLKTAKMFEKPKKREESRSENRDSVGDNPKNGSESMDPDPFAVYLIHLCTESRILCFAGATHLALCRFSKQELNVEVQVMYKHFRLLSWFLLPPPFFSTGHFVTRLLNKLKYHVRYFRHCLIPLRLAWWIKL